MFRATRFAADPDLEVDDLLEADDDIDDEDLDDLDDDDDEDFGADEDPGDEDDDPDEFDFGQARIAAAAAAAPTIRADGSFVLTVDATCRVCGCTSQHGCPGGCIWAEPNLCSRCARLA